MKNWRLGDSARDSVESLINEIEVLENEVDNLKEEVERLTNESDKKDERILELEQELYEAKNN